MIARRRLVLSASLAPALTPALAPALVPALTPLLASCATDLRAHRQASLQDLAASLGVCAATFATLRGGRLQEVAAVSGCAGDKPAADAVFQAASLTKPVVARAVLQLVQARRPDLQSPVSRYLPAGTRHFHSVLARGASDRSDDVPPAMLARIPLRTLLSHTSGLPNWAGRPMSLGFEPGTRWAYSGEGYMLLQAVIEAVTAQDFAAFMQAQVFGPLQMTRSSLVWHEDVVTPAAQAGSARSVRFHSPAAAASLHTTSADYARFLAATLADAPLLELTTSSPVVVDAALGVSWGLGWGLERSDQGRLLWHWGNNPGFRSFTMISPASGDGFVIFTASDRGMPLAVPLAYEVLPMDHPVFSFPKVG